MKTPHPTSSQAAENEIAKLRLALRLVKSDLEAALLGEFDLEEAVKTSLRTANEALN